MRRRDFLALALWSASACATPGEGRDDGQAVSHPLSGIRDFDDNPLPLPPPRGQIILLDFWASWCGPCRLSLPALNRLQKDFDPSDFSIVAISVDYVDEDALDFLKRYPVDYPVLIDKTGDSGRAFSVAGMPSGYLLDRDGLIREIHVGFRKGDEEQLRESISALIQASEKR